MFALKGKLWRCRCVPHDATSAVLWMPPSTESGVAVRSLLCRPAEPHCDERHIGVRTPSLRVDVTRQRVDVNSLSSRVRLLGHCLDEFLISLV